MGDYGGRDVNYGCRGTTALQPNGTNSLWGCRAVTLWQPQIGFIFHAAVVIRQPYKPTIGIVVSHGVCRAITLWQPQIVIIFHTAVVIRQPYRPTIWIVVPHGVCRTVTPWQPHIISPFFIKLIQFPFHRVMLDILGNVVHFRPIPNDMVMETRLPCE